MFNSWSFVWLTTAIGLFVIAAVNIHIPYVFWPCDIGVMLCCIMARRSMDNGE